jgi:hypothetical protein
MSPADAIPVPSSEHVITLGTLGTVIAGVVAWVLKSALPALIKQHRDDIFQLHKECREERAADRDRHERELAKRDERFELVLDQLTELAQSLGQLGLRGEAAPAIGPARSDAAN